MICTARDRRRNTVVVRTVFYRRRGAHAYCRMPCLSCILDDARELKRISATGLLCTRVFIIIHMHLCQITIPTYYRILCISYIYIIYALRAHSTIIYDYYCTGLVSARSIHGIMIIYIIYIIL
jgi:hypothetical protein